MGKSMANFFCRAMACSLLWGLGMFGQSMFGQSTAGRSSAPPPVTVIRAGTLIDGKSDRPRRDQVIVIRGNRIESVSDAANAKIPAGAKVIDLSRETVLPGLIDSHTHIFLQGEDPVEGGYDA